MLRITKAALAPQMDWPVTQYDEDDDPLVEHRSDAEILSLAEDLADESDLVSLADPPRIERSADGHTARVAAWVMVPCAQFAEPAREA